MVDTSAVLRQNPSLLLHETDGGLALWVADRPSITITGDVAPILSVLGAVNGRRDYSAIVDDLRDSMSRDSIAEVLDFCLNENLVKVTQERAELLDPHSLVKWDRQISNFTTLDGVDDVAALGFHQKLTEAHVLILGVGGVGSYLASSCAMIGLGRLTLVDFDDVELSNTSRQILYDESDVGRPKLEAAADDLRQRNSQLSLLTISHQVSDRHDMATVLAKAEDELGRVDLVLLAADQPRQTLPYAVDAACCERRIPFLMMSPHDFSRSAIGPLVVPGVTRTYAELVPQSIARVDDPRIDLINSRFVANIMDPYNGLNAKMAMVEVVKFLTNYRPSSVLGRIVDLDTATWEMNTHVLDS